MQTKELTQIAFRKLKSFVYYDKTSLPLRDKVVSFEASKEFTKKIENIAQIFDNGVSLDSNVLFLEIISSISTSTFPKKMKSIEHRDDVVISVGSPKKKAIVSEPQHFIDMMVEGHILGIMWILKFGQRLNNECIKNAKGNKLRSALIWSEDNEPINSPALFEPYFTQYSSWRDDALTCAEELLKKNHDALILTLDLKRFYYNTGITNDTFQNILKDTDSNENKVLHNVIFAILKRYSEVLEEKNTKISGIALPIGFLPSAVLSNWCLSNFDKGILDFWNPSYYGRYVDDIIIVEKIERGSEVFIKAQEDKLTKDFIIDYYLGDGRRKGADKFVEKISSRNSDDFTATSKNKQLLPKKIKDSTYRVTVPFCLSSYSCYEFQSAKTRIITLFADNNSTALINKFRKEIYENVSAFRLMPDVGKAFSQDDFSDFYQLDNDATINKLRGVKNISMDKYELSKFLGRYRVVSSLVDDVKIKGFTKIIGKMFNECEIIENYTLWERILEIFITDRDYVGFIKFSKGIKSAIENLTSVEIHTVESLKQSLVRHFVATINRVLSLLWGKNAEKIINAISNNISLDLRQSYFTTRMTNKYVMVIPPDTITCPTDNININLTHFADCSEYLCSKNVISGISYDLLPYFRQAQDISIEMLLNVIFSCSVEKNPASQSDYLHKVSNNVPNAPVKIISSIKDRDIISIGKEQTDKLRIAIANVDVSTVSSLESALKGRKLNRTYKRYQTLTELVNKAIKENADMLVLPECFVPFEWLPALASKAANENLAIVTGVEHLKVSNNVYNYTAVILPFKYFGTIPTAAIFFQLKKFYAPEESRIIEGYGLKPVAETLNRPLYRWHDCYFPVYCCYELASIIDRAEYMSWSDMVIAVEYNSDTNYFSNIVESLSRDLHCYFVQVNTSQYGDSRITQPTKSEIRNIISVKGGLNSTLLIGEINIKELREFQIKNYNLQKSGYFKPTPPGIDTSIIWQKMSYHGREQ